MIELTLNISRPCPHTEWIIFQCGGFHPIMMIAIHPSTKRKICPVCGSFAAGGIYQCADCKKTFFRDRHARNISRCSDCQAINVEILKKRAIIKYKKEQKNNDSHSVFAVERKIKPRKWCANYEECLSEAAHKNKRFVDCRGCEKYEYKPLHAQISSQGDSMTPVSFGNKYR